VLPPRTLTPNPNPSRKLHRRPFLTTQTHTNPVGKPYPLTPNPKGCTPIATHANPREKIRTKKSGKTDTNTERKNEENPPPKQVKIEVIFFMKIEIEK